MGLICPCGTGADVEEQLPGPKTASTGCSTQQKPTGQDGSHNSHDKRSSSSSKKHLLSKEEEAGLVTEVNGTLQSKGISCTPGEIQKISHSGGKETQRGKPRRSRSSSSYRERVNLDTERSKKHQRRHHSTDAKHREKKSILYIKADKGYHKGYGGTEVTRNKDTKIAGDLDRTDRKKKHGKHCSKILNNSSDLKVSGIHQEAEARGDSRHGPPKDVLQTPDIIKGKKKPQHTTDPRNRVKYMGTGDVSISTSFKGERLKSVNTVKQSEMSHVPVENKEKPFKETGNEKHRKPRNKPPAYVIPIAAMLE